MSSEQIRVCIYYEYKLSHSAAEATRNIMKVWGEDSVTERTVQRWFVRFRAGDFNLEDKPREGRPTGIDNDVLKEHIQAEPSQTLRELALIFNVTHKTIANHLHCMGKVWKHDRWVPYKLSDKNKCQRLTICTSLVLRNHSDPFLNRIITSDEKWITYDNIRRSGQWLDVLEPPGKVAKRDIHSKKTMVTVWWSMSGVIYYEFLKQGKTITSDVYCEQLDKMNEKLKIQQPALINRKVPLLLHDNAKPHTSKLTVQKLKDLGYETLPHPPYSPDIAPTDFWLFRSLANFLAGKSFKSQQEVENAFRIFIESKNPSFYKSGIEKVVERWLKVIEADGDYFNE